MVCEQVNEMDIFSPIMINGLMIPNHLLLAPINIGHFIEGHRQKEFIDFYSKRSGNHIGVTYVGNVAIEQEMGTNSTTAYFSNSNLEEWIELVHLIQENGSVPAIQLGCYFSKIKPMRGWINNHPREYIELVRKELGELSKATLDMLMEQFYDTACKAYQCGFKIIQLHAAHGYLLSLLCSPFFNPREDEYNPFDLLFLEKLALKISNNIPSAVLDIRLSFLCGIDERLKEEKEAFVFVEKIANMPFHIISVSNGIYNINKNYIYPGKNISEEGYLSFGKMLSQKYPDKYWNIAGNLHSLELINKYYSNNLLFSFGRQMICDPLFIEKYISNRTDEIILCSHCGKCHYYSNYESSLQV